MTKIKIINKMLAGFTLAEVLITLGIIGIVAAMTIPTLIQKEQEQQTVTALKKAYSELSQAYTLAVQENGTPDNWDLRTQGDPTGLANLNSIMTEHLKVSKNCGMGVGCFPHVVYKDLNGLDAFSLDASGFESTAMLSDGTSISFNIWDKNCGSGWGNSPALKTICGEIVIDTNGFKKPNKWGTDLFDFILTKYGIIPDGTSLQTNFSFDKFCNLSKSSVSNSWDNGASCSAWVIYNENMDYLHCKDLSWSGKTKCD